MRFLGLFGLSGSLALGLALGCSNSVERGGSTRGAETPTPSGTGTPTGTATTPVPMGTDTPGTLPPGVSTTPGVPLPAAGPLGPVAVRRLSNEEYDNTVQDLLQVAPGTAAGFQPDARNLGYRNIAAALTVPLVVAELYGTAAEKLAAQVSANVTTWAPCAAADAAGETACAQSFINSFGAKAFRRPINSEELTAYSKIFDDERARTTYAEGIGAVVETLLQSPYFLYKTEIGAGSGLARQLSPHELATQISYLVTGTMPDATLMAAADANQLATPDQREAQVRRLFGSGRTPTWLRGFITQWTVISNLPNVQKDPAFFPSYDAQLRSAIIEESNRFVDEVFAKEGGSLTTLFTANWSILNPTTAAHYGVSNAPADWQKTTLPDGQRLGILTSAGFLAANAKAIDSFPIRRGATLRTHILCRPLAPPPPGFVPTDPEPSTALTTRERFAAHSQNPVCASCHREIDPLGLGFENYDGIGSYRTTENGKPVDASGEIVNVSPEVDGPFANAVAFVQKIANSQVLKDCVARESFRWGLGRANREMPTDMASPDYAAQLEKYQRDAAIIGAMSASMTASPTSDIRELLVGLARSEAYPYRVEQ
ncbi:MAG: DUF1592 domain-containing protein [Polyangiaceae bacterium]|nr:DUF1592 domain-containing protein [Polyangiaceae bacterium]